MTKILTSLEAHSE